MKIAGITRRLPSLLKIGCLAIPAMLLFSRVTSSQEPQQTDNSAPPALYGLEMKDFIEVLADYTLVHTDVPMTTDWYGMVVYDQRKIWLVDQQDLTWRRKSAIHEIMHVARRLHGDEAMTDAEEEAVIRPSVEVIYKKLYGK